MTVNTCTDCSECIMQRNGAPHPLVALDFYCCSIRSPETFAISRIRAKNNFLLCNPVIHHGADFRGGDWRTQLSASLACKLMNGSTMKPKATTYPNPHTFCAAFTSGSEVVR